MAHQSTASDGRATRGFAAAPERRLAKDCCSCVALELTKKVQTALDETRMLILGAQILLGFQLRGVFQEAYEELPAYARHAHGAALALMVIVVGLLILPGPFHRQVEEGGDTGHFHRLVYRVMGLALLPFAAALGLDIFIAGERIVGSTAALAFAAAAALLAISFWYGLGEVRKRQVGEKERAMTEKQRNERQRTPLHTKIDQMLTEARVILPGVQALLGFQLAIVLTKAFEQLPTTLKLTHGAALLSIVVAIVLLMTPAAYHRIVYGGEDADEFHRLGSRFLTISTIPLALGLALDIWVVATKISGSEKLAALAAVVAFAFLIGLWHGLPVIARRRRRAHEGRKATHRYA
jgi:hypothetical protein